MPTTTHPTYHFSVDWGGTRTGFTEVSGLSIEIDTIEYREGGALSEVIKTPGLRKFRNITLKRGIVKGDNEFFQWINTIQGNTVQKRNVVIRLLNERHEPIMSWKIMNAWPVKLESSDLKANANETAIETLELAHEGLIIEMD